MYTLKKELLFVHNSHTHTRLLTKRNKKKYIYLLLFIKNIFLLSIKKVFIEYDWLNYVQQLYSLKKGTIVLVNDVAMKPKNIWMSVEMWTSLLPLHLCQNIVIRYSEILDRSTYSITLIWMCHPFYKNWHVRL